MTTLLLLSTTFLLSQNNNIKLDLYPLSDRNIELEYEFKIKDKVSLQISALWHTPRKYPPPDDSQMVEDIDYPVLTGFGIKPEIRYYPYKEGEMLGLYYNFYLNYRLRTIKIEEFFNYGIETDGDISLNTVGGGLGLGYKWEINNKFIIDWNIIGIGYNRNNLTLSIVPDNPDEFSDLKEAALDRNERNQNSLYSPIIPDYRDEILAAIDRIEFLNRSFSFLDLRFGFSVGYIF